MTNLKNFFDKLEIIKPPQIYLTTIKSLTQIINSVNKYLLIGYNIIETPISQ